MLRFQEGYKNKYLDPASSFLCDDSLHQGYKKHHEDFVPIFPRTRMPGSGTALTTPFSTGLRGFPELPKVAVEHSDDDNDSISMQNLMVVDGWGDLFLIIIDYFVLKLLLVTFPPSTPPPTTTDSSDDQIDEIVLQSTPNTEPAPIAELFNAQMGPSPPSLINLVLMLIYIIDVPQFPRSRKIGGNAGIEPHILAKKSLVSLTTD